MNTLSDELDAGPWPSFVRDMKREIKVETEPLLTECDNCGKQIDVDETHGCEQCGATLCPGCICENCEEEME